MAVADCQVITCSLCIQGERLTVLTRWDSNCLALTVQVRGLQSYANELQSKRCIRPLHIPFSLTGEKKLFYQYGPKGNISNVNKNGHIRTYSIQTYTQLTRTRCAEIHSRLSFLHCSHNPDLLSLHTAICPSPSVRLSLPPSLYPFLTLCTTASLRREALNSLGAKLESASNLIL